MLGSFFRGRPLAWDPDSQRAEQYRQRWVSRQVLIDNGRAESVRELESLAALDPDQEYERHRAGYVKTGDRSELALMLEFVR